MAAEYEQFAERRSLTVIDANDDENRSWRPIAGASGCSDGSGKRRPARLEKRAWRSRNYKFRSGDRIKLDVPEIDRQHRRKRSERRSQGCLRRANGTKIVRMTVMLVVLPIVVLRNDGKQNAGGGLPAANILQMKMAK